MIKVPMYRDSSPISTTIFSFQATCRDRWPSWTCVVPCLTGFECWALFASAGVQSLQIASRVTTTNRTSIRRHRHL
jgi:hypothetical protein